MGLDIAGAIELRGEQLGSDWRQVADVDDLYGGRCYDLFGCLFGVRNFANFAPLFADRGFPQDLSSEVLDRLAGDEFTEEGDPPWWSRPTWCSFDELRSINRSEPALKADDRVHEFRIVDGEEVYQSKSGHSDELEDLGVYNRLKKEPMVRIGDTVYRRVLLRRGDVLPSFDPVIEKMRDAAQRHGADRVRLIVWFF